MKVCSKCNMEKNETEYYRQHSNKDGLKTHCKECDKKHNIQRYRNPEVRKYILERGRQFNKSYKGKEYHKQYWLDNKERFKERIKQYTEDNKSHLNEYGKQYYKKIKMINPRIIWASSTITIHKKNGYDVRFSAKELTERANATLLCQIPWCSVPLNWELDIKKGLTTQNSPTLDRINNEKIMVPENTQIICLSCNTRKQNKTMKEYKAWINGNYTKICTKCKIEKPSIEYYKNGTGPYVLKSMCIICANLERKRYGDYHD